MTRTVAFYLPQFHRIPENDLWWGEGFTEWTNVRRALPQFRGHYQPQVPADLGYYDLTNAEVFEAQTRLARQYGVDAFCMYFYWFDGQRLLERPVEEYRRRPNLLPYCLSWANENWSRRWDGKSREVLMPQSYEDGYAELVFRDLLPHLRAPHYLRQHGRPILVIHRPDMLPDAQSLAAAWRRLAEISGLDGLYLIGAETSPGLSPSDFGFDAMAEFPPVGSNTLAHAYLRPVQDLVPRFQGRLLSYDKLAQTFEARRTPAHVVHRGVTPRWDNTPRRGRSATIYVGSTPGRFREWYRFAHNSETAQRASNGLLFVNAWNEWAEGAQLEPETLWGTQYLAAMLDEGRAQRDLCRRSVRQPHGRRWRWGQLRGISILVAGSLLQVLRRLRRWVG